MTLLPPRPRFLVLLCSQAIGAAMVFAGIVPYLIKLRGAWLPETIYWRAITCGGILAAMFFGPLVYNFWDPVVGSYDDAPRPEALANNHKIVRVFIWLYCLLDLVILTYLVHITGGLTGSMYAGLYLLIPSLAVLVMFSSTDLKWVPLLIGLAMIGIAYAYWMSGPPGHIECNAAQHPAAFNLAVHLVSQLGAILLFIQVSILKRQFARPQSPEQPQNPQSPEQPQK